MSSRRQIKNPNKRDNKKGSIEEADFNPTWKLPLSIRVSTLQVHRRPSSRTSPALWSLLFFPWDSSGKGLEIAVPHPHGELVQGLIPLENILFSWQPATLVGQAVAVTPAWQSMLHAVPHMHAGFYPVSFALTVSYFVLPPLSGLALHYLLGRKVRKCRQEGKKKKKASAFSQSHFSPSRSHSVTHSLTSAWRFAPVCGMSWPCLRGVPAPSAKPIDPLITSCCTSFRKSLYMYNLNTHMSAERKLWCRTYLEYMFHV